VCNRVQRLASNSKVVSFMEYFPRQHPPSRSTVPAEYRALHKFLSTRFADTVVLTFAQIEDLLGFALPDVARHEPDWWTDGRASGTASVQASSWTQANRTARPNLRAKTVTFDRTAA